jgi:hypothetical protein
MKTKKGKAIGDIASLRDLVTKEVKLEGPEATAGNKGNKSSAGGGKLKKDGNRRKRNKGRS